MNRTAMAARVATLRLTCTESCIDLEHVPLQAAALTLDPATGDRGGITPDRATATGGGAARANGWCGGHYRCLPPRDACHTSLWLQLCMPSMAAIMLLWRPLRWCVLHALFCHFCQPEP